MSFQDADSIASRNVGTIGVLEAGELDRVPVDQMALTDAIQAIILALFSVFILLEELPRSQV